MSIFAVENGGEETRGCGASQRAAGHCRTFFFLHLFRASRRSIDVGVSVSYPCKVISFSNEVGLWDMIKKMQTKGQVCPEQWWKIHGIRNKHAEVHGSILSCLGPTIVQQSGRYVNLRTPSCHGKRRVSGTRSYASYRDRFRPKTCHASGRRSSRAESGVTIDRLLSCFGSRRNGACKPDEQCKSNGRKLFLQSPTARRNGKVNASFIENRRKIQALRVSEARRWRRVWSVDGNGLLLMHSLFFPDGLSVIERRCCSWWRPSIGRCIRSATIAKGVAEEWTSKHSGRGWRLLWGNDRWRELHKEEPTPVADVPRPGSWSEPRKLRLPLIFLQTPNHWRKCQERCRRVFFSHNREVRWVRCPGSDRTPVSPVRTEPDGPQKRLGES